LLLTARHGTGQLIHLIGQPDDLQQVYRAGASFALRVFPGQVHRQDHILQQAQGRQHLKELKDDADVLAAPGGETIFIHPVDPLAGHDDLAARRSIDARDHVEQGGFAVARRPDNRQKFTGLYLKETPLKMVTSLLPTGIFSRRL
jgi:hypothetical protein